MMNCKDSDPNRHIFMLQTIFQSERLLIIRYPDKAKEITTTMLQKIEERGIIETSTSARLSLIVLVKKPNGDKRLCLDWMFTRLSPCKHPVSQGRVPSSMAWGPMERQPDRNIMHH